MKRPRHRPARCVAVAVAAAALSLHPSAGSAQSTGGEDLQHVCGDCHGPHTTNPGARALVRRGRSEVAELAPGIGSVTVQCLQCHGTEGDRRQAQSDRTVPVDDPVYLGKNLRDDHPMGWLGVEVGGAAYGPDLRARETYALDRLRPDYDPDLAVQCASCHQPHEPQSVTMPSVTQTQTCLSCHAPGLGIGAHSGAPCGTCHRMHAAPAEDHLGRERVSDFLCGACHDGAPEPLNAGIQPVVPGQPLHLEPSSTRCSDCHVLHAGALDPYLGGGG